MDRSVVLQAINGYLAVTGLWAAFIFWRYITRNKSRGYREIRPAIALFAMCFGTVVLRAPQFVARTMANAGFAVDQPNVVLVIGGMIVEASFLCIIRVFAPEEWGQWSWFCAFVSSSLVVLVSLFFVQWS